MWSGELNVVTVSYVGEFSFVVAVQSSNRLLKVSRVFVNDPDLIFDYSIRHYVMIYIRRVVVASGPLFVVVFQLMVRCRICV